MIVANLLLVILYITMAIWVYISVEDNTSKFIGQKEMIIFSLCWPILCPTCVISALLLKFFEGREEK